MKAIYKATLGKKTVMGGLCVVLGMVIGGPVGAGLGKVGELVLVVGLGDKGIRAVIDKKRGPQTAGRSPKN